MNFYDFEVLFHLGDFECLIVSFWDSKLYYGFVLKRCLRRLKEKNVFKLSLIVTPKQCETIEFIEISLQLKIRE